MCKPAERESREKVLMDKFGSLPEKDVRTTRFIVNGNGEILVWTADVQRLGKDFVGKLGTSTGEG